MFTRNTAEINKLDEIAKLQEDNSLTKKEDNYGRNPF